MTNQTEHATRLSPEVFAGMRSAMVASQLRTNAVNDPRVVAAMARVPREAFVPEEVRAFAYLDRTIPLGRGRYQNTPVSTGRLLTESYLEPGDRVLLIGAAGGYTAAVLAELVATVTAVESDPALAGFARGALAGVRGVTLVEGGLAAGVPDGAPYDVLIIDGAVEEIPQALIDQVRPGGRAAAGLIDRGVTRLATGRRSGGGFGITTFADMECARLPGFEKPRAFTF